MTRRGFIAAAPALAAPSRLPGKPAVLGGTPVRNKPFPDWPITAANDEEAILKAFRSRKWNRNSGRFTAEFESAWAQTLGARHCLAVANGTSALVTAMNVLGVGPGDEVIVPPYTIVATVNAVLLQHALPVFVDTNIDTFQIDARKIEAAITPRTVAIMPVHLGGAAADMDVVLDVARRKNIPVVEDACQAHFGEWRGKKVSTLGTMGCFSFQASKNLNSGEGGAVITNDDRLIEQCRAFHNNGRGFGKSDFGYSGSGCNLRITEFQGALLSSQLSRLDAQSRTREQNAAHLTKLLSAIEGITPAKLHDGCTRNAYHLYMFRFDAAKFSGLTRAKFLKALAAEGIPCSSGYRPLNREAFLKNTFATRGYRRVYSERELAQWEERNRCPANDRLCEEAVWFTQNMLLAPRTDMDAIAEAISRIRDHAAEIARMSA